jgi:PD-(D/E)XK nuclease superfamily
MRASEHSFCEGTAGLFRVQRARFEQSLRVDILIDNLLIVELKAVEKVLPTTRLNF